MSAWEQLAGRLATDPTLRHLEEHQVKAIIDVLAHVVYADEDATLLERATFRDQLGKLPWIADKQAFGEDALKAALASARSHPIDAFEGVAVRAADALSSTEAQSAVFRMAATMAWVDLDLHPTELKQLDILATVFGITDGPAIIKQVAPLPM